jgi:hypothetical protein
MSLTDTSNESKETTNYDPVFVASLNCSSSNSTDLQLRLSKAHNQPDVAASESQVSLHGSQVAFANRSSIAF